jgi:hypothetical protein
MDSMKICYDILIVVDTLRISNQLFELSGINKSEIYNKFYFQVIQEND